MGQKGFTGYIINKWIMKHNIFFCRLFVFNKKHPISFYYEWIWHNVYEKWMLLIYYIYSQNDSIKFKMTLPLF